MENLSETAEDFEPVMDEVPDLGLTLDVGHANLDGAVNKSIAITEKFGNLIRHVHLHDNRGGQSKDDDLHLPIGARHCRFSGNNGFAIESGVLWDDDFGGETGISGGFVKLHPKAVIKTCPAQRHMI
jgi:hypothetical protein